MSPSSSPLLLLWLRQAIWYHCDTECYRVERTRSSWETLIELCQNTTSWVTNSSGGESECPPVSYDYQHSRWPFSLVHPLIPRTQVVTQRLLCALSYDMRENDPRGRGAQNQDTIIRIPLSIKLMDLFISQSFILRRNVYTDLNIKEFNHFLDGIWNCFPLQADKTPPLGSLFFPRFVFEF